MEDTGAKVIRVLNAFSALVLAFAGLWMFVTVLFHARFTIWGLFGPCFLILFGFLLVAAEFGKEDLLDEFGFLKTFLGRGLFYIFLAGIVCYAYAAIDSSVVAADIYGTIFFSLGVLYIVMNFYVLFIPIIIAQWKNRQSVKDTLSIKLIVILQHKQQQYQNYMDLSKYRSEIIGFDLNCLEVLPPEIVVFEYINSKSINSKIEIKNTTGVEKMFRVLTTQASHYRIIPNLGQIASQGKVDIKIQLFCAESRLDHRLKDKFRIDFVDKNKYDQSNDENKWKSIQKQVILSVSLKRKEIITQFSIVKNAQSIRRVGRASSQKLDDSRRIASSSIHSINRFGNVEDRQLKQKLEKLQKRYEEQAILIVIVQRKLGIIQI